MTRFAIALLAALFPVDANAQTCSAWSAWARFTCVGACASGNAPPTIVAGGNASSMSRTWSGTYTLNFTPGALPSGASSYGCYGSNVTSSGSGSQLVIAGGQTQVSVTFQTLINGGPFADPTLYGFIHCEGN